jgi:hypothetical protein
MPVSNATLFNATLKQCCMLIEEALHVATDVLVDVGRNGPLNERRHLIEVLVPIGDNRCQRAVLVHAWARRCSRVKASQPASDAPRQAGVRQPTRQEVRQHALVGQTTHPDSRLTRPLGSAYTEPTVPLCDLDDAKVDVRAEPTIEAHLLFAVGTAPFDGGEVQKAEIYGLLELVGVVTRKHHPRAVRFMKPQVVRGMVIGLESEQVCDQLWLTVSLGLQCWLRHLRTTIMPRRLPLAQRASGRHGDLVALAEPAQPKGQRDQQDAEDDRIRSDQPNQCESASARNDHEGNAKYDRKNAAEHEPPFVLDGLYVDGWLLLPPEHQ